MGVDATGRRRRLGALMLLAALAMLIAGETFLKARLRDLGLLLYWLLCFVLTGLAMFVAYVDARTLQRRTQREARELIENTLNEIEMDAKKGPVPLRPGDGRQPHAVWKPPWQPARPSGRGTRPR